MLFSDFLCFRIFGLSSPLACVCVSSVCSPGLVAAGRASDGYAGSDSGEAPGHSQYPGPVSDHLGPETEIFGTQKS